MEAKVLTRDQSGIRIEIKNPTKYDARVSLVAENAREANQPLGAGALLQWRKVHVKAGETRNVQITPAGQIHQNQ
jgi:P pilus assembly chaperone PapD